MSEGQNGQLKKIRALLDMANDEAISPEAAENYRLKAFELMAKYGIEQALLNHAHPGADKPTGRVIDLDNPWAVEKIRFLAGLARSVGCELIQIPRRDDEPGRRAHIFGYGADLERLELLFTNLLTQMFGELSRTPVPPSENPRSFRHAWILGFASRVVQRVQEAEQRAQGEAPAATSDGRSTALVLADRKALVQRAFRDAYPRTRRGGKIMVRGNGFAAGTAAGNRADIGSQRVSGRARAALTH